MTKIVGVSFKENGKIYYFDLNKVELNNETDVIVETEKGLEYAKVVSNNPDVSFESDDKELSKVIRVATSKDKSNYNKNKKDAEKALIKASELSEKLGLKMTFVDSSFSFERTQLMLYFISENRVDFRELARELASIYKTRIELRQIGIRDKAKEVSGLGPCGRKLCCSSFLNNLDSVSISMAKNQNLALNPAKINGSCGRLLCCLTYEDELYQENRKGMPEVGDIVETKYGEGNVIFIDIPNRKYIVNIPDHGTETICLKCKENGKSNK
jgi:cell fate regulator YaaT (PSP1 superfamily)